MEVLSANCPACNSSGLTVRQKIIDVPHFGEVMVSSLLCGSCGYRHTDVISTTTKAPRRYTYSFNDESGLNARVIRSGSSTVRIPEFGIRIDPGGASEGYITNIEGLLWKILGIIDHLESDLRASLANPDADTADIEKRIDLSMNLRKEIERMINGELGTTIIIEDPYGNSAIIHDSDHVKVEDLSKEEVLALLDTGKHQS
ncbi:MAG: ZPR1 zinc finger domain-containing protein [Thermoplasmatota archaeon]